MEFAHLEIVRWPAELVSQILTLADADLMSSDLRLTVSLFLLERFTDWSPNKHPLY